MLYVLGITLVYGIVALTNLGSLRAPQTYWDAKTAGESMTVHFERTEHIAAYSIYGNIDKDGTLLVSTPSGHEETFAQTYDDMFRWKKVSTDFTANEVTLTLYSGTLKLNEMAFFDDNDQLIPIASVSGMRRRNNCSTSRIRLTQFQATTMECILTSCTMGARPMNTCTI
jgi:hypothetical protein